MRVAHFVQRYPPALGGSEAYFARLGGYLAEAGDMVETFTTTALDLEAFWSRRGRCLPAGTGTENGVTVHRYPLWRWPGRRYLLKALSYVPLHRVQSLALPCNPIAWQMWREAGRAGRPFDVVHATALPYTWPMACGLRLARRLRVPFLVTPFLHTGDPNDPNDRTRQAYLSPGLLQLVHAADRIFVQTEVESRALEDRGIPATKLVRLGMGVEPAECTGGNREQTRRAWQVADDEVVIGHLGNNSIEKGTVDLLRAAEALWQQGQRFRVVLAGPAMPNFERFWQGYGPVSRVRRLGVLDDRQLRDFFAGIDGFALPSRSDSFGLVFLEAWANGLPNVAYRAGGVAEVLRHEHDGLLVRCGDVAELADAVRALIADCDLRNRLGEAGRQRAAREFRWRDKLDLVRSVYLEMVGDRRLRERPQSPVPRSKSALSGLQARP
jgi:glycosyltransferase involved in cell wall biosynthesis